MGSDMTSRTFRGSARDSTAMHRHRRGAQERAVFASTDVRLTLPARPENVAVIRHVLGAFAEALRLPPELVEDMRLAVTEACTNVVRHAYTGVEADDQNAMRVELRPRPGGMIVIVEDRGRGVSPSPDGGGPGLGLPLIAALTEDLAITHGPGSRGSRVAMSFAPVIEAA
jgi:serine/threonine-protein kinase RsbW